MQSTSDDRRSRARRSPKQASPWLSLLLWLGLLLVLTGAAWLLLSACGLTWLGARPNLIYCRDLRAEAAERQTAILAEQRRQEARRDELARLQRELAGLPPCPIVVQAEPPVEAPPVEEVRPLPPEPPVKPLPPEAPPEEPPPPETPPETTPETTPDLPEDRWNEKDLSLLDGCWSLASDYRIRNIVTGRTKSVTDWQVCFDDSGRGRQTLRFSDGTSCAAPVIARFEGDQALRIDDADNVPCSDDSYIHRREITCRRISDHRADCTAYQEETNSRSAVSLGR